MIRGQRTAARCYEARGKQQTAVEHCMSGTDCCTSWAVHHPRMQKSNNRRSSSATAACWHVTPLHAACLRTFLAASFSRLSLPAMACSCFCCGAAAVLALLAAACAACSAACASSSCFCRWQRRHTGADAEHREHNVSRRRNM